jgi:hypothetical protein
LSPRPARATSLRTPRRSASASPRARSERRRAKDGTVARRRCRSGDGDEQDDDEKSPHVVSPVRFVPAPRTRRTRRGRCAVYRAKSRPVAISDSSRRSRPTRVRRSRIAVRDRVSGHYKLVKWLSSCGTA